MVCLHHAEHGGGGLQRSCMTEGVVGAVALHAVRTAVREAFEIVEQGCSAVEAGEDLPRRLGAVEQDQLQALRVDEGETGDLSGALVDEQLHAMLDDDDMGFDTGAGFRVGEEVVELLRSSRQVTSQFRYSRVISRSRATGSSGNRMRKRTRNSSVMGWSMTPASGPVESGSRYPPSLLARALKSGVKVFGRPANWMTLHPPFSHQPVGVSPSVSRLCRDPPPPVPCTGGGKATVGCLSMRSRGRWIGRVAHETEGDGEVWLRW